MLLAPEVSQRNGEDKHKWSMAYVDDKHNVKDKRNVDGAQCVDDKQIKMHNDSKHFISRQCPPPDLCEGIKTTVTVPVQSWAATVQTSIPGTSSCILAPRLRNMHEGIYGSPFV